MENEKDYVLGTHDEEIERLGLQHRIWRPRSADAWRRAGFTTGQTLLDIGCGAGYATLDLAGIVGRSGRVVGIDRSRRFLDAAAASARAQGIDHVSWIEHDLDDEAFPAGVSNGATRKTPPFADGAWSRWVYAFVRNPRKLLGKVATALRPGAAAVLYEYVDYRAWRISPGNPLFDEFVREVMASWREHGGEPDIAMDLPRWLQEEGFEIREMRPLIEITRPGDFFWEWPRAFMEVGLARLVELGRMDARRAEAVQAAFLASQAEPGAFLLTPTVLEIIAIKR